MAGIRRARPEDAPGIHVAHTSAIRVLCRTHYAPDDVEAWAGRAAPAGHLDGIAHRDVVVAEAGGRIVGFGDFDAGEREVRAVYVHPDVAGTGIGRELLGVLENTARLRGVAEVRLDASRNAEGFYRDAGWRREGDTRHVFPGGRDIACVRMTKALAPLRLALHDETPAETAAIHALAAAAFGREDEAVLVDRLRAAGALALSLVALLDDAVIGHVGFSPVAIAGAERILGLAPTAVLPAYQRCAIGSRLVEEGLARARERGARGVVVLGHPHFYPRFGFVPASRFGLGYDPAVPDDAFMAAELVPGALAGARGRARYRPEFDAL